MGFDDYSYKFNNDTVLNAKAIAAINDDENTSLIAALEVKTGNGGGGGGGINEKDSILTAENVREFESTAHFDEEGLNDFITKAGSTKELAKIEEVRRGEDDGEEEKAKDSDKDSDAQSGEDNGDDPDANQGSDQKQRNKLTKQIVEELKYMQEQNLFEDILDIKNEVKLAHLQNNKTVRLPLQVNLDLESD